MKKNLISYQGIDENHSNPFKKIDQNILIGQDKSQINQQSNKNSSSKKNSKKKIKLVSPFKNAKNMAQTLSPSFMKDNQQQLYMSYKPTYVDLQLGGKRKHQQKGNKRQIYKSPVSITTKQQLKEYPSQNISQAFQKKVFQKKNLILVDQPATPQKIISVLTVNRKSSPEKLKFEQLISHRALQSPQKTKSPQKIIINNKQFNLNNLKSHIVYVKPIIYHKKSNSSHPYTSEQPQFTESILKQDFSSIQNDHSTPNPNNWPTDLIIQEQNQLQTIKDTYQCQMRQILQLKQQIQQNNIQIKQLLHTSRLSKQLKSDRTSNAEILEIPLKINESIIYNNIVNKETNTNKNEISIQTDLYNSIVQNTLHKKSSQDERKSINLSLTKNVQCQVNLMFNMNNEEKKVLCKSQQLRQLLFSQQGNRNLSFQQQEQNNINKNENKETTFANLSMISNKSIKSQKSQDKNVQTIQHIQVKNISKINNNSKQSHNKLISSQNKKSQQIINQTIKKQQKKLNKQQQQINTKNIPIKVQPLSSNKISSKQNVQIKLKSKQSITDNNIQIAIKKSSKIQIENKIKQQDKPRNNMGDIKSIQTGIKKKINNSIYL